MPLLIKLKEDEGGEDEGEEDKVGERGGSCLILRKALLLLIRILPCSVLSIIFSVLKTL